MPNTEMYVNLPVDDLARAQTFWTALGYSLDPEMNDESAAMVRISDTIFVMLLTKPFFGRFTDKEIADTQATVGGIYCLSAPSRAAVDELVQKALAAGGGPSNGEVQDENMYCRSFTDPDGHHWEVMHWGPDEELTG